MNKDVVFHFHAQKGWINDPNGFCFFKGKYHLFYQYDPNHTVPETIGWGHACSKDLIKWEHLPIAIYPENDYEQEGVWSGSAVEKDKKLYLIYTGNKNHNNDQHQSICVAISTDGINFEKYHKNPVIELSKQSLFGSYVDFRDPYVIKRKNDYLLLVGTKLNEKARVLAYSTKDLINYSYLGVFYENDNLGTMFECPSFVENAGLIVSPQNVLKKDNDYWNISSSVFISGSVKNNKLISNKVTEIDHGLEFYAPQTRKVKGKEIMIAWMNMWGRKYYLHENGNEFEGIMTLPRILKIHNGKLIQNPVKAIDKYKEKPKTISVTPKLYPLKNSCYLKLCICETNKIYFGSPNDNCSIEVNFNTKEIIFDRKQSKVQLLGIENTGSELGYRKISFESKKVKMEIYIDYYSIEIFVNGGQDTFTNLMYIDKPLFIYSSNDILKVKYCGIMKK